jgi:hypothetical protein
MKRTALRLILALGLIGLGWAVGRAQGAGPDFEIRIDAPEGQTILQCVRGCQLAWIERMVPEAVKPTDAPFTYACSNSQTGRCASGRVGGWIKH